MSTPAPPLGRPTVDQVARLIRARTKDANGNEVGTFDDETRPTADEVETIIDDSYDLVMVSLPAMLKLEPFPELIAGTAQVVALEAACRIEKAYWPEQVRTDRSNYSVLKTERDEALQALKETGQLATGGGEYEYTFASWPVGSWTMIGSSVCCPPETEPAP